MSIEIKDTEDELYIIIDGKKFNGDGIKNYLIKRSLTESEIKVTFLAKNLITFINKNNTKKKDY